MKSIDLRGIWRYETDESDIGITEGFFKRPLESDGFVLPGSTCDNKIGKKQEYYSELNKDTVRAPRERYEYIGALWLQREIEIPSEWDGKCVTLFLERVNIASDLWIDGVKIDRQIIELSAPHIYRLTKRVKSGKHTLTLRIDNRNLLSLDTMASGYSVDTQGYWNGVIGKIELRCEEVYHLENIQVYPDSNGVDVKMTVTSDIYSPEKQGSAKLEISVVSPSGATLGTHKYEKTLFNSKQVERFRFDIESPELWDEFEQPMYTLNVRLITQSITDEKSVRFGMRTIKIQNKEFNLNGRPLALRGTIDCAQYMLTGYPPMEIDLWRKNFKTIKSYGLNHVRFHAWCPPECAFDAADEVGLYISVEMPLWLNYDVCALETGDDPIHRYYFTNEALTISKTYGNHPSFIMFSNGNENMGDFEMLEDITTQIKAYDGRRLYTLTSNFDHPVVPCEDYLCAFEAGGNRVRLQTFGDEVGEGSFIDYSKAVSEVSVPVVSFEVGQYCVYPDVDGMEKYTGNMMPVNLDVIKKHMLEKNVYHKLADYVKASGRLALKMYKEDIEAAMRTKGFGGFELLSLCDYTGQCTATVGMLDVFYDSKGITDEKEFSAFCNSVVPLFKSKRIYKNTEILEGELDLYDYGKEPILNPEFDIKIYIGGELFYSEKTREKRIVVPLGGIKKSAVLRVEVSVEGYTNEWRVFVMASRTNEFNVQILEGNSPELADMIENGGKAVITGGALKKPIKGAFLPVFWSPAYFASRKTCGMTVDCGHAVFDDFPTEQYSDFQWKKPLEKSVGADISGFSAEFEAIVEPVPNFFDNVPRSPLFEARVGKADILFCGFDLTADDDASRQLAESVLRYASSEKFSPKQSVDKDVFSALFCE